MENNPKKTGFFDGMNSKASFTFGLVAGIALIAVLGVVFMASGSFEPDRSDALSDEKTVVAAPTPSQAPTARPPAGDPPPVTDEDHVRGDKNAPLTFIEYSDFECPFCKRFTPTMEQMMDEYDGQIKLVYRHFPLSFHNPLATTQAEATECANEYGGNDAFWEMHDFIFETTSSNGNGMTESQLVTFAGELGINESKFQSCLDDDRYKDHVADDMAGGSSAGVTGTPGSFFIDANGNTELISGAVPYTQIKAMIDAAL